jgi:hypothetical protein
MRAGGVGESALLLLDVVELLGRRGIEYAVIGALAASVHGAIRASMDADVVNRQTYPRRRISRGHLLRRDLSRS